MRWEQLHPIAYPPVPPAPNQESSSTILERIQTELTARPSQRLVCYGAGNDFKSAVHRGLFDGHQVVGVLDDRLAVGGKAAGFDIVAPAALGSLRPDLLIITTSAHRVTLLQRATGMVQALGLTTTIV
jgi:hypothetical protein